MTIRKFAVVSAAAVAVAGLLSAAPAYAHTSQPSSPEEIQQTDALNAQALANARMGMVANRPSANADMPTADMPTDVAPPITDNTMNGDGAMPAPQQPATPAAPTTPSTTTTP